MQPPDNGSLTVSGGTAQISTGDDALHADLELVIEAGDLDITTCYEGLSVKGKMNGFVNAQSCVP